MIAVPIPEPAKTVETEKIEAFCKERIPSDLRDKIRLEYAARGNAITILERRRSTSNALEADGFRGLPPGSFAAPSLGVESA